MSSVYRRTISTLKNLEKKFPASNFLDDAAYTIGLAYFNKQDYGSAKLALKRFQDDFRASEIRPKALYLLGNCFYNLGDFASATQVFKEIPGSGTLDAELIQKAEYGQADSFYQMGKEEEALSRFKALRSKYPASGFTPDIIWWLGTYYYHHKEPDLATRYFLSLIQDFSKSDLIPDAYYALGLTLLEESKDKEAEGYLKKALTSNKTDVKSKAASALARLYFKIAEAQEAKGNLDEALKEYLEVTKIPAESTAFIVTALFRSGRVYEDKGNPQEAIKVYTRILNMNLPESKYAEERINQLKPLDK